MPAKRGLGGDERRGGETRGVSREGAREEPGHEDEPGEDEGHRRPAGARLVDLHRGRLAREKGAASTFIRTGCSKFETMPGP